MEKLKLAPESLQVESFVPALSNEMRGTVAAHDGGPTNAHSCLRTACCPETYQATCQC